MITVMNIVPVRAFRDNYIWLLIKDRHAVAVDPGDAIPIQAYLRQFGLTLCGILITHHHEDHIGGVDALTELNDIPVYAPSNEQYSFPHRPVAEGDIITLPELEFSLRVLDIPGHTSGHVAYYGGNSLFCGDTLFGGGCGRVFDSTCQHLYRSLLKISLLPDDTEIYCAHEYTLENLRFARTVDPDNSQLAERENRDTAFIMQGWPTIPSTLAIEKATNPFMRCHIGAIQSAAGLKKPDFPNKTEATFCAIREMKNNYKS